VSSLATVASSTPSATDRRLKIAIGVVAVIGIGIASYLTYVHYAGLKVLCLSSGGCETVQSSKWAKLDGVPVAVLGLIGYVTILGSLAIRGDAGRAAGFGVALIGFLFSAYLTFREGFSIHAWCQWCIASAILMTTLMLLTGWRVLRDDKQTPPEPAVDLPPRARASKPVSTNGGRATASSGRRRR
jgi:uncharacterized membrane protein